MMNMFTLWIPVTVLCISGLLAAAENVTVSVDETLTLPCTYSVSYGIATICWGRGSCPFSKCINVLIWTDGITVTWRKSDRYHLLGNISQGDVSLIITGATAEDEGTYCCLVGIPGWFNDVKKEIRVKLREVPVILQRSCCPAVLLSGANYHC
ncbi:hepatitis A virus cellular receptor 1 homolog isoform X2 [Mixophyes fleayi]|uniref:hepatitis A virus cellular receptor 1 homolog isoform X2 n=1 Tax=Mixophyes fleayi TaxID=3061075 RepID=UPI003F4E35A7